MRDMHDRLVMQRAASDGQVSVLQFLKEWGITRKDVRSDDNLVLRWAARNGHVSVLQLLKEWGITLDDVRSGGNFALRWAAANEHVHVLQFFKEWWESSGHEQDWCLLSNDVRDALKFVGNENPCLTRTTQFLQAWLQEINLYLCFERGCDHLNMR